MTRQCYSTDALPPGQQFAYWRESICQAFAALDPVAEADRGQAFPSLVEVDALPGASLSLVQSQAQRVLRAAPQIRSDPRERLFVNLMLRGSGQVEQGGQRSLVAAGDVYVVDTARPYALQHTQAFRLLCLSLPHQALLGPGRPPPVFAQARPTGQGQARLAVALLHQLRQAAPSLPADCSAEALALATGWLGRTLAAPGAAPAMPAPPLQDLWRRALRLIEADLRDPALSPPAIAAALKVSLRYLHKAFAAQGATVSGTVRGLRLQRCAEALRHQPGRRSIAAIAADWGFGDMPHFNRLFRQRFGHTPGAHRAGQYSARGTPNAASGTTL